MSKVLLVDPGKVRRGPGPLHQGLVFHALLLQQLELEQDLDAMAQVPCWLCHKTLQTGPGIGQGGGKVGKSWAVPRNHNCRVQRLNHIQGVGYGIKGLHALELGKDHAKAPLPQGVGRQQHPRHRLKQHHRVGVMARRGMHLPQALTQPYLAARLQQRIKAKLRASLAGRRVGEGVYIPVPHRLGQPRGYGGAQGRIPALQGRVAAAVVAVQMGVEQLVQRSPAQGRPDQRQGLWCMGGIAAVDQGRAVLSEQQDIV